jgi:hypothetical protein
MKRSTGLLVAAIGLALASPLAAQDGYGGLVLKGGLSYGDVSNSGVLPGDAGSRSGVAIGLGFLTGGPLGFGFEGLYAQRGVTGGPGNARELDYIDVPAYLRLGLTNPLLEPFAYAGPQVSFELKCESNGGTCPSGRPGTTFAGIIGAGARLPALGGISVEGRYVYGLTDLKLGTVTDSESYQTRSFLILVGFGF